MDSQNSKINILILGATGLLGSFVTKHCLAKTNLLVNILVRNPQKNPELTAQVENAGGKVFKGDISQPETLKGITKGIHTVIITLNDNVAVQDQITFINQCVEDKVERIVPAEFSSNSSKFSRQELDSCPLVLNKFKIVEYLKTLPVKTLTINIGIIMDWFFQDVVSKEFGYWGDAKTKLQITSYEDSAKVVASAVSKKDLSGDFVFIANDLTMEEVVDIYNRVRGTNLKAKRYGSLEDLNAQADELEKKGDPTGLILRLGAYMFDERARFEKDNNADFPEIRGTSIEDFLRERPDVQVGL